VKYDRWCAELNRLTEMDDAAILIAKQIEAYIKARQPAKLRALGLQCSEDCDIHITEGYAAWMNDSLKEDRLKMVGLAILSRVTRWLRNWDADQALEYTYRYIDAITAAHQPKNDDFKITCKPGCYYCCRQLVGVSEPEARRLAVFASRANQQRVAEQAQWSMIEWPTKKLAARECPFLGADRLCSVYEHRPLACRNHRSVDPPEKCDEAQNTGPVRFCNDGRIALLIAAFLYIYPVKSSIAAYLARWPQS
jgi:Fe-S-cluster containining protein